MKPGLFILMFLIQLASYSQDYGIKKIKGYYSEHVPGNIPVGENGKPLHKYPVINYHVFIETNSKTSIKWMAAWSSEKNYRLTASEIKSFPFEVGKKKNNEEKIELSPGKGNKLWQLEFADADKKTKSPLKIKSGEIILRGMYKGKLFYKRISKLEELYVIPSA